MHYSLAQCGTMRIWLFFLSKNILCKVPSWFNLYLYFLFIVTIVCTNNFPPEYQLIDCLFKVAWEDTDMLIIIRGHPACIPDQNCLLRNIFIFHLGSVSHRFNSSVSGVGERVEDTKLRLGRTFETSEKKVQNKKWNIG